MFVAFCFVPHMNEITWFLPYYSAIRKDEILPFVTTWMDLERVRLSEVSQMKKHKHF